jgi:3-deoxy-D-arabino-heptulosonate 7-phosphate (DAHP) synthase
LARWRLEADGITAEIHKNLEQAATDGQQASDCAQFAELMKRVKSVEAALW